MRRLLFSLCLFLLGLKKNSDYKDKKYLVILIDGLSYKSLATGIRTKSCPTIVKLLKQDYIAAPYYCGLPATTTATEALLFYGLNHNIPGFTWYDRTLRLFIRGNRGKELSMFEDCYQKKRELFTNGSVIMGVFSGGATQLVMSGRNLHLPKTSAMFKIMQYAVLTVLYPIQLIRTVILTLKTLIAYKADNRDQSKNILETIFLGQFSCFLTEVELFRGTSRIFVDFLLYDEFAHRYGPAHPTATNSLKIIDRYVRRILKSVKNSGFTYEVIILSDHGQSKSIPYDETCENSTNDIAASFQLHPDKIVKTYGTAVDSNTSEIIYSIPGGSTLHLYFSHSLERAYYEEELQKKYPSCVQNLLSKPAFGWILVRCSEHSSRLYGKKGSVLFVQNQKPLIMGDPFNGLSEITVDRLLSSMSSYVHFPNNGDIVIFGNITSKNEVYSFERHKGTHGGFYGEMCFPFCITNNALLKNELVYKNMTMETLFDKIEYNMR